MIPRSPLAFRNARQRRNEQIKLGVIAFLSGAIISRLLWPDLYAHQFPPIAQPVASADDPTSAHYPTSAYYPNCDAARAAGVAPILSGQPGYRPPLDPDNDGIACEPYRGRR